MSDTARKVLTAAAMAGLLGASALPAAAQLPGNQGVLGRPDPFMQEGVMNDRDWYEGPMAQWYENRAGRDWDLNRIYQDSYNRGYQSGRNDERMARDRLDRTQSAREWMGSGRATYSEARDYLDRARRQIDQGNLRDAWVALGRAETRLLTRAGSREPGEQAAAGGAVGTIRDARDALMNRNPELASNLTQRASNLVRRGYIIGETVSGRVLSGAGYAGERQPFFPDRSSGSD